MADVGGCLLSDATRAETLARLTGGFNLDKVDAAKQREVQVQLRLPSKNEFLSIMMMRLLEQRGKPAPEEMPAVAQMAKAAVEPYFVGDAGRAWMTRVEHGDTTIVFEGVPHDVKHIVNRAFADAESSHPTAIGNHPNVLKRLHPNASDEQIAQLNKPDNRHSLMAVNGTALLNYQQDGIDMRQKFGHVLELVEARASINEANEEQLYPYVKIGTIDGRNSTFNVNNLHQVCAGNGYFGKEGLPPPGALHAALMHEHFHVINGDFSSPAMQTVNRLSQALPVENIRTASLASPTESAEAYLHAAGGHVEIAQQIFDTMSEHLTALTNTLEPVYTHLEATPWLNEVDGVKVAADIDGENHFQNHVAAAPAFEMPAKSVAVCMKLAQHAREKGAQKAAGDLKAEDVAQVQQAMEHLFAQHADMFDGLQTIRKVGTALNHASEYRADIKAAEHLDNPQDIETMLRWAAQGSDTSRRSYSHPSIDERGKLLEAQKQPVDESNVKPVLGRHTASEAKRAATVQDRGI